MAAPLTEKRTDVDLWMPGATKFDRSDWSGIDMAGGPAVAVWHTTEGGFEGSHATLEAEHYWPHLLWDPATGRTIQYLPADRWARALESGNKAGRVVVQIEVVGRAAIPFTSGPMVGLAELLRWLDSLGIPRVSPPSGWLPYPESYGASRVRGSGWGQSGHFGHQHVPGNSHGDPGGIDPLRLLLGGAPAVTTEEDDVTEADLISAVRKALNLRPDAGLTIPAGQRDANGLYANMLGTVQALQRDVAALRHENGEVKALLVAATAPPPATT